MDDDPDPDGEDEDGVALETSAEVRPPDVEASATVRYGLDRLREEIGRADSNLDEPVEAYLVGGGAMAYADLKGATKDIDIVLEDQSSFQLLEDALVAGGYDRVDPEGPYEALDASGIFERDDAPRWDVYVEQVAGKLHLSPGMMDRAVRIEPDLDQLRLFRVDPADIFIFKSITGRDGDQADMDSILAEGLDWESVLEEMRWQDDNATRLWTPTFVQTLEGLAEAGRDIPILDELRELANERSGRELVLLQVEGGADSVAEIEEGLADLEEGVSWVGAVVEDLIEEGALRREDGGLVSRRN